MKLKSVKNILNLPKIVYTDALRAYKEDISQTFGYNNKQIDYIAKYGITKPHTSIRR